MLKTHYPYYLANQPQQSNVERNVLDKYTGEPVAQATWAGPEAIEQAIAAAHNAAPALRKLPAFRRREVLLHCAQSFAERQAELAQLLCIEAGKPLVHSRGEVARLIDTFEIAAEEAARIGGEVMPLDRTAPNAGRLGFTKRVPVGPCSFITPFNFPLNLAAHKMAPALAAGCPFILKPSEKTPLSALVLGETLAQAGLPEGAFSILPCDLQHVGPLIEDERIQLLSFTGSAQVGWPLKARAGKKKVLLELGGNAGCIVDESAHLDDAVERIAFGAFYQSGQSCISVQRIYLHDRIYDAAKAKLIEAARDLPAGSPHDEETFIGPLITTEAADRVQAWIDQARQNGGTLLCGGNRSGNLIDATLMENVGPQEPLSCQEVFGPVVLLNRFSQFEDALHAVNQSDFGLQAGVFTQDLRHAQAAWDELEVGGVMINEIPSWRADAMPYGGVKDSGFGREGLRWAIEDMTELRLMVWRTP